MTGRRAHFVLGLLLAMMLAGCHKKAPPPAPQVVLYLSVTPTNVPIYEEWIGTLDGFVNAQIRAQVTGYLQSQHYAEGGMVKRGDLLFQIDPRPFEATLDQARARLAQDKAQQGLAQLNVNRYIPLAKEQAISQQELDNAVQGNLGALAQIQADEAAITNAQLNLGFTRITSPIDGIAGTALAQIGDLVTPGGNILTTVSTVNPIRVYFQVSEQSYLTFWRKFGVGQTNQDLPLQLILGDGAVYPEKGRFYFTDRQVNPTTGTIQICGLFSNANFVLRPGQYGRVRAMTDIKTNVVVVPPRAVTELQGTYQVSLIGQTNQIHIQSVQVGAQVSQGWIIDSGLKAGDRVVIEGLQKAREGGVVDPKPYPGGTGTNNAAAPNP